MTLQDLLLEQNILGHIAPGRREISIGELPAGYVFCPCAAGGGLAFQCRPPYDGWYEGHWLFVRGGRVALRGMRHCSSHLFTTTRAKGILGIIPREYRVARTMVRAAGFSPAGEKVDGAGRPCKMYTLERGAWEAYQKTCSDLSAIT